MQHAFTQDYISIVLFYYLFTLFIRYVLPFLLKASYQENTGEILPEGTGRNKDDSEKEGDVNINYASEKKSKKKGKKKSDDDLGEFVDYEEIED